MAVNNGTVTDPYSGRTSFYLRLYVWRSSLDIAGNRSKWSWWARAYNPNRNKQTYSLANGPWSVTVAGESWSGTQQLDFRGGQEYIAIGSGATDWVSHNSSGALTVAFSASHGPVSIFATASLSGSFAADVIPQTPTGLTVTRVSDSQQSLSWSKQGTTTGCVVQRRVDSGSGFGSWTQVAAPSGNLTSYSDTTTVGNRRYQYRVAGKAAAGQSGWSNTVTIVTTPAAPTGLAATRVGDDIQVAASIAALATHLDIQDETTNVVTALAKSALPWTHTSPNPAVTHRYRARARVASGGTGSTTLYSGWSGYSNTVQLAAPPNAPTGLSPNGAVADVADPVRLSWVHNPVDSSAQSAYELRHRVPAGAWTTLSGTTASFRDVTLPVGVREWQVRTKGGHPDWGAWSATATVEVINAPGVAVTQPDGTWEASILPVEWSYMQTQSRPQSAWQVELIQDSTVETRSGSGAAASVTLHTHLTEGDWTVRVRAATGGIWSDWAASNFTVVFDPPLPPLLEGEWDESAGGVVLTIAPQEDGVAVPTAYVEAHRQVEGDVWELVGVFPEATTVIDYESLSYGATLYRATAFTVEGATAETLIQVDAFSDSIWLGGGSGFGDIARLPFDPQPGIQAGRARTLKQWAGRERPVAYVGEATSRVVSLSGRILDRDPDGADVEALTRIAQSAHERHCFRDPDGRRIYGVLSVVDMPRSFATTHPTGWEGVWSFSFTLTEADDA